MLVLSRKPQETIVVDGRISITVVEVRGNQVRLGIQAPKDVSVQRQELLLRGGEREVVLPLVRALKSSPLPSESRQSASRQSASRHSAATSDFRSLTTDELFGAESAEDSATTATL